MDNKRSWIWVALVLATTTLVVHQFSCQCALSGNRVDKNETDGLITQVYKYVLGNVYSSEELNDFLGYTLPMQLGRRNKGLRYIDSYPDDQRLVDLLAWTKNKDEPGTILGKYSVNELLDWNNYHPEDCNTDGKMVEHSKKCAEVRPDNQSLPEDPSIRDRVQQDNYHPRPRSRQPPLDYMRYYNLHRYCTKTLEYLELRCNWQLFGEPDAGPVDLLRETPT